MLKRWNPDRPHMIVSLFSWCGLGFAIIPWPHQMETAEWCGALTHLHWIQPKTIPDQAWNWALSPYWCTHRWPRKKKKKVGLQWKFISVASTFKVSYFLDSKRENAIFTRAQTLPYCHISHEWTLKAWDSGNFFFLFLFRPPSSGIAHLAES